MSLEEWWGATFERRGSVLLTNWDGQLSSMRKLSTPHILELITSEDTRSVRGLLAHMERKRREDWTSRAALVVSIIALVVAAIH